MANESIPLVVSDDDDDYSSAVDELSACSGSPNHILTGLFDRQVLRTSPHRRYNINGNSIDNKNKQPSTLPQTTIPLKSQQAVPIESESPSRVLPRSIEGDEGAALDPAGDENEDDESSSETPPPLSTIEFLPSWESEISSYTGPQRQSIDRPKHIGEPLDSLAYCGVSDSTKRQTQMKRIPQGPLTADDDDEGGSYSELWNLLRGSGRFNKHNQKTHTLSEETTIPLMNGQAVKINTQSCCSSVAPLVKLIEDGEAAVPTNDDDNDEAKSANEKNPPTQSAVVEILQSSGRESAPFSSYNRSHNSSRQQAIGQPLDSLAYCNDLKGRPHVIPKDDDDPSHDDDDGSSSSSSESNDGDDEDSLSLSLWSGRFDSVTSTVELQLRWFAMIGTGDDSSTVKTGDSSIETYNRHLKNRH